jgi:hypothetical protein
MRSVKKKIEDAAMHEIKIHTCSLVYNFCVCNSFLCLLETEIKTKDETSREDAQIVNNWKNCL